MSDKRPNNLPKITYHRSGLDLTPEMRAMLEDVSKNSPVDYKKRLAIALLEAATNLSDSLSAIAKKYDVTYALLANTMHKIRRGKTLTSLTNSHDSSNNALAAYMKAKAKSKPEPAIKPTLQGTASVDLKTGFITNGLEWLLAQNNFWTFAMFSDLVLHFMPYIDANTLLNFTEANPHKFIDRK